MAYVAIAVLAVFVITCVIRHIWWSIEQRKYIEGYIEWISACFALEQAEVDKRRRIANRELYGSEFAEKYPNFRKSA
jgi:hypothetical protein